MKIAEMSLPEMVAKFKEATVLEVLHNHFSKMRDKEVAALHKAKVPQAHVDAIVAHWAPGDGPEFLRAFRKIAKVKPETKAAVAKKLALGS